MPDYYSVRRLSPFLGTLQVVALEQARAISTNGLDWRLEARRVVSRKTWGELCPEVSASRYIPYAMWSGTEGLRRLPVPPMTPVDDLRRGAEQALAALQAGLGNLPFPAGDHLEFWLLDGEQALPLALLASARPEARREPPPGRPEWLPARTGDLSFVSSSLEAAGVSPRPGGHQPQYHINLLADQVKNLAQHPASAQWFRRESDGSGFGLEGVHLAEKFRERRLPPEAFPELLLRENWADRQARELVADFIAWQAPLLLTLPHLLSPTRIRLEQLAGADPLAVRQYYRLYPEVMQRELLNKILVEAVLRQGSEPY